MSMLQWTDLSLLLRLLYTKAFYSPSLITQAPPTIATCREHHAVVIFAYRCDSLHRSHESGTMNSVDLQGEKQVLKLRIIIRFYKILSVLNF